MNLESRDAGKFRVIAVHESRIDAAAAIRFKDAMREKTGEALSHVLLDLSEVEFIDSSGLGAIVAAMKHLGPQRRMDLAGLTPMVDRVFRLTRMDTVFTIYDTVAQAERAPAG
ncbi:STAS domain-containing protein [Aquicoccus sp. G2-2]|uniref:STAS domain-containing protein n=1 Tax=Aquicoccus sp. G2-2 TaxID=3092120 RepID=UPI002AE004FA|nr:STAS domain-containing protein [Aquicoccus sp. G2-2]MEA1114544.1 STAS domain-containing protein [Aquicoccus sp. G2-2]